ncbi:uncharacterized protein [Temnothorax nylanderi]|uniref:uncharacterized protein n=1 Tax=Temnothorax nylanderi TaxID=102681 RepID=UPI003A858C5E
MEQKMAVDIVTKNPMLQEENVQIGTIIGDDDSSTIANVRREAHHAVEKESDKNHATCTLSKDMWKLKIPSKIIEYMKYCFGCVLLKNKGNVENVRAGLLNIVPHAFDDHEKCGMWCAYKEDPTNYKHRLLPGGKGLTDPNMKASLTAIFKKFAANAEKLAPCGSTQANEAFHTIVASKAPKSRHYGGSESNDFRVAAAVCQKNYGTAYVINIHEKLDISPGKNTAKFREKKDKIKKALRKSAKTVEAKKRRRSLFQGRHAMNNNAESREGITYSSGCGFNAMVDVDNPISLQNEGIPNDSILVFFDLETTGLNSTSEIIQISAKRGPEEFDAYMLPTHEISRAASIVTGLTVENGELNLHGQQVVTTPRRVAMLRFLEFIKPGPTILVAHNGRRFDTPMLLRELQSLGLMVEFRAIACGFCDSLPVLKKKLPERVKAKQSFRLSVLAEEFIGDNASAGAHNGAVDVRILEDIIRVVGITDEELRGESISIEGIFIEEAQNAKTKLNKNSFDCIKEGVSAGMKTKMAKAGLTFNHLKESFLEGGEDAVTVLLASDVNGHPRVTKNKKVIQRIITQIKNVIENS